MAKLTDKQARFVEEYLVDLNATQAAMRAGYSCNSAHAIGHENLRKPDIAKAVQAAFVERSERTRVTQAQVIEGLRKEAQNPETSGSARVAALAWLGKHLGMFTPKIQQDPEAPPVIRIVLTGGELDAEEWQKRARAHQEQLARRRGLQAAG